MRKIRHFFLTTLAVLCSTLTTWAAYSGTPAEPTQISGNYADYGLSADFDGYYVISTAEELYGFAALVNGGTTSANAVLTDDIVVNLNVPADGELNGATMHSWTPIGTYSKYFKGTFDGNGHTISGLYFENTTNRNYPDGGNNVGLIGRAIDATIKNVGVIDSYLRGYQLVGGICGDCSNRATITNCYNTGTVMGYNYVGGICGDRGTQTNCYNTGTVKGTFLVGGICGGSNGAQTNCYYLAGCARDRYTVQNGVGSHQSGQTTADMTGTTTATTAEEFASGKITYLLNGSTNEGNIAWRQTLGDGNDAFPVLDNTHRVVYATQPCESEFSNTPNVHKDHGVTNGIGYCPVCDKYITAATLTDGVYQIGNAAQLYWFAQLVNEGETTANAVLTADIVVNKNVLNDDGTLNGTPTYSWTPIGTSRNNFKGTFDGNGHTISGLYFNNTTNNGGNNVGLIGRAIEAIIKNVGVVDSYLKGNNYVGGICGYNYNSTTITNCYNTGTVSGQQFVGGICGTSTTITNCYNIGMVLGYYYSYVGGICGGEGTLTSCYYLEGCCSENDGSVSATAEEFASGEITYLLNGSTSGNNNVWRQNLDNGAVDAYPVLDKNHGVVYLTHTCVTTEFSNSYKEHPSMTATGYCTACGQFIAKGTLVTESNRDSLNLSSDFVGYYAISNSGELYWLANEVNNGDTTINAVLTKDITVNTTVLTAEGELNGTPTYSWTPIGTYDNKYKGTFDGNGHTISGLYFKNTTNSNYPDGGKYI